MTLEIGDFSNHPLRRWKNFFLKSTWLYRALGLAFFYAISVLIIRFVSLTLITYFSMGANAGLQDINDIFSSNEVSLMGMSALVFVLIILKINPISYSRREDFINREGIEKQFLSGFLKGAFFCSALVLASILCGVHRYLGYFIRFNEAPLELINTMLRLVTLGVLAYCEEFIFHHKLAGYFKDELPSWASAHFIAALYCGIKILQFDLGIMHLLTLYLISIYLFYERQRTGRFERGAGYWAAILIVLQPLASLPIFGNDFTGLLLIKYQPNMGSNWCRMITGGPGGPISSLAFQLLLLLDLLRSMLTKKER
jgi:hypothetical protein